MRALFAASRHFSLVVVIFSIFMLALILSVGISYSRKAGSSGLDMGKIQQIRHSLKRNDRKQ